MELELMEFSEAFVTVCSLSLSCCPVARVRMVPVCWAVATGGKKRMDGQELFEFQVPTEGLLGHCV
jgi:hypothetical protein